MTRMEQSAAFLRLLAALATIALITIAANVEALRIGPAGAGLLYLLPVLWVSARSGLAAGLSCAALAAFCYNFFLLDPRYTLRLHGVADIAAFVVLIVVAAVTSRLASNLRAREVEALQRAEASAVEAEFVALLARHDARETLDRAAMTFLRARYGEAVLVDAEDIAAKRTGLAPLDAAAAAWALHNGGETGHASEVMPSADFRFVPLAKGGDDVLGLAWTDGSRNEPAEVAPSLARSWTQARDRLCAQAERQARQQAEQREHVRRSLLAALGHDFRTPLTVLKAGLAELDGKAAARLGLEVDRIARLGEDLIAAARLDSGQIARSEPIDLVDIVAAATPVFPNDGTARLHVQVPSDAPLARGDAVMLVHLVGNLVANALRHAKANVWVTVHGEADGVVLTVRDDGDGIEPSIASTLFDRFATTSDRHGGSGLGLAIARDLAEAMGATLTAQNDDAGGARFSLRLTAYTPSGPATL